MRYGILASGGAPSGGALPIVVGLVFAVGIAYLLTHFVVDRLQRRFLFISGSEYVLLGLALGPLVPAIPAFQETASLGPIISLGAGWIGLVYGVAFFLRGKTPDPDVIRVAIIETIGTGVLVAGASYALLTRGAWFFRSAHANVMQSSWAFGPETLPVYSYQDALLASLLLGCASAARSGSASSLIKARYQTESKTLAFLSDTAKISDVLAILAFGLLFCVFHTATENIGRPTVWSDWFLLTQALGVGLGLLFGLFLGRDDNPHAHNGFLALVGIIAIASGAAFYLQLSALLVNLMLGFVLVNTSSSARTLTANIGSSIRPLRLILLIFAGALFTPVPVAITVILVVALFVTRLGAKFVSGWFATIGLPVRRDIARGLLAQGDVALAMALSLSFAFDNPLIAVVYTVIIINSLINELIAPRILRGLIIDAGELQDEVRISQLTSG